MSSMNGRFATNTSRLKLMERPMATTAVAAAASLPSSLTWNNKLVLNCYTILNRLGIVYVSILMMIKKLVIHCFDALFAVSFTLTTMSCIL